MLYSGLMILMAFICIAMMWTEGMWGNAITSINVIFAAMLAMNFYEPVATFMEARLPSFTYLLDFVCQWFLFAVALSVLRITTDQASQHQVRFKMPLEQAGRAIFAVATAWVLICFTTATMHTAPLGRSPFRGSFQREPLANNLFGLAPDRLFLGFVHSRSKTALANPTPTPFDAKGDYILKYGARRQALQEHNAKEGSTRVR
jgi:hypothetical protein